MNRISLAALVWVKLSACSTPTVTIQVRILQFENNVKGLTKSDDI